MVLNLPETWHGRTLGWTSKRYRITFSFREFLTFRFLRKFRLWSSHGFFKQIKEFLLTKNCLKTCLNLEGKGALNNYYWDNKQQWSPRTAYNHTSSKHLILFVVLNFKKRMYRQTEGRYKDNYHYLCDCGSEKWINKIQVYLKLGIGDAWAGQMRAVASPLRSANLRPSYLVENLGLACPIGSKIMKLLSKNSIICWNSGMR